jgi:hypothetical protein
VRRYCHPYDLRSDRGDHAAGKELSKPANLTRRSGNVSDWFPGLGPRIVPMALF